MGLEKEKSDARIFMNDEEFHRTAAPMLHAREKGEENPDRDPHGLNSSLQVGFEDVIAEPSTTHSFDKVWICSHALFEVSKYLIYKLLTVFLAIPLAFVVGLVFAVLTCVHIWVVMPFIKTCLMVLPSVQTIWKNTTDAFITPVFTSIGKAFSSVRVRLVKD